MGPASSSIVYRAAHGVIEGRWVDEPWLAVDEGGTITALGHAGQAEPPAELLQRDLGPVMLLPGMVDAHSHAFQRAIRGATHRRGAHDPSSFWSWREAMYARAQTLDPEGVHAITRQAFAEMLHARVRHEWGHESETPNAEDLIAERYRGIRPAFGYPACPDHTPKQRLFELLDAGSAGITLSEHMAMLPTASVSGLLCRASAWCGWTLSTRW